MLHLALEDELLIGKTKQVGVHSTQHDNLVVIFEDDGETGYFYALDLKNVGQPVVDSLHIYNVDATKEREQPRKLQICWDETGYQAYLLVNDYPHASFDFSGLVGYNHNKFPEPQPETMWTHKEVTEELVTEWLS
ncbi:Uncharacterized protein conserved in bacteria [Phocoenobacter uteri]|uniref:Uncharacterized protein conserved in bacteria n=1 Tax=Phocoenobacter uteri TaxID=146806 RepID=A0A379C7E0_9PAST|nr:DUF2251 domain-containing protein [Phocoenobacter uteri]MDG6882081.1 hypothetical protein [Phocoenobacter uteri]SUB58230.1 Uncharacterized protein conserved in bacteria [Phocoenobacter uteri]